MKFSESVKGHPRVSPGCQGGFKTPQRSILRCPGTSEMIKLEKLKISIQTEGLGYYMSRGGSNFHLSCLFMLTMTRRAYFNDAQKSNTGSGRT